MISTNPQSKPIVDLSVVAAVQTAVGAQTSLVVREIADLTIASNDDYRAGDLLLVRIRQARKTAEEIFAEKIRVPILEPLRKSLDSLYALEREITKTPFDLAEKTVKSKMALWQDGERRRIEAEKMAAQQEELRKLRAAQDAQRQADLAASQARTAAQKRDAEAARIRAQQIAEEAEQARQVAIEAEQQRIVKGVGSKVTVKRKPVVTDLIAFAKGVIAGTIPAICLQVNEDVIEEYWKQDAGLVSAWSGVTIQEETRVGGR